MSRTGILQLVMVLSIAFQFIAAFMALRLIRVSGVIVAWSLIASALVVMGIRRAVALLQILNGTSQGSMTVELLGLLISLLMAFGIYRIKPLFDQLIQSRQELLAKQIQLEDFNRTLEARVAREVAANIEKDRLMMRQAREAVMGEMIGNIAHQWKQPLNNLALTVQEMQYSHRDRPLTDEEMERGTARSMELIRFMSHTIDDFRNFFSPRKQILKFSLASEVERALAFVAGSYQGKGIALSKQIEEDAELEGYPNELTQVLMNILQNAADAFEGKRVAAPQVNVLVTRQQSRALIVICDNAGGIAADMLGRIFDAYATSKENGTGIGLYMARMIVERSFNGSISAANVEGGAEFRISL